MSARSVVAPAARVVARGLVHARTAGWSDHSRLFAVGERTTWSVDEDARQLQATAVRLGYELAPSGWARFARCQSVFLSSPFEALQARWLDSTHRLGTAYLHGRPGTEGSPEFDRAYKTLRAAPARFRRIQVTHGEMRDLVLDAGVDPASVHVIPIGIDIEHFAYGSRERRTSARDVLGLPLDAFVVGSFQKDGVGWGEGLEPKRVKGPDVLVDALALVATEVDDLHVLLTGPARGYVRMELERHGIPYRHVVANNRAELARAYHALDAYVVSSRQEGGPKGVLEALATGAPLVTTRVGQAPAIVRDEVDALVVDVDDPAALASAVLRIHRDAALAASLASVGRPRAEEYAYERLDAAWDALLDGFVVRRA